ncbi:MAG: hypothetical protein KF779_15995 [Hyphomonadaceae bacterium]|nr:hypothetical protein [Hyphomonadaceae bacterium]MCA8885107.1 hypothetical protein [Hyphomonadaceae bacterium]
MATQRDTLYDTGVTGTSPTTRSLGQRLAAYLALLAIAVQCFVVQPHIDPLVLTAPRAAATAASDAPPAIVVAASSDQAHHAAAGCAICQTALAGGHGIAPTASADHVEQAGLFISSPLPERPPLTATPSHSWQSRGPPQLI